MGDQASEKFEKRWSMNATEWHWEAHLKRCALEDAALESEAKSLPDKLAEVNQELQELSRKVRGDGGDLVTGLFGYRVEESGVCRRWGTGRPDGAGGAPLNKRRARLPLPPPDLPLIPLPPPLQVEAHGEPLPPGPGREMSFEEKRRLSHHMGSLAGERLVHVLQIIAEGPSAPALVSQAASPGR